MAIDMAWYVLVAVFLTGTPLLEWLRNNGMLVNRTTALVLMGLCYFRIRHYGLGLTLTSWTKEGRAA
jgi:hypothetical protein